VSKHVAINKTDLYSDVIDFLYFLPSNRSSGENLNTYLRPRQNFPQDKMASK